MRGQFYSIMIALFVIPILALIIFYSQNVVPKNIDTSIRSDELSYFSQSTGEDLGRFLDINGKRALISAVSVVLANGVGMTDAKQGLTEMIENGTLDGEPAPLVDQKNLETWENDMSNVASNLGFNLYFLSMQVNVTQVDSLSVMFNTTVYVNISDNNAGMYVLKNITAAVPVSIDGVEDPLFPLYTHGTVSRFMNVSPFAKSTSPLVIGQNSSNLTSIVFGYALVKNASELTPQDSNSSMILVTDSLANASQIAIASGFAGVVSENNLVISPPLIGKAITGAAGARRAISHDNGTMIYLDGATKGVWDLTNLTSEIKNGYYQSSTNGPSFFDRLEGKTALNAAKYGPYGLESFVYLPDLDTPDLSASVLDYQYFKGVSGSLLRGGRLQSYDYVYSWFRIDGTAASDYGINSLIG